MGQLLPLQDNPPLFKAFEHGMLKKGSPLQLANTFTGTDVTITLSSNSELKDFKTIVKEIFLEDRLIQCFRDWADMNCSDNVFFNTSFVNISYHSGLVMNLLFHSHADFSMYRMASPLSNFLEMMTVEAHEKEIFHKETEFVVR